MPRRGALRVGIQFHFFQQEPCPAGHVLNIRGMERPGQEEALARFEVAATEEKAKLIGGRAQARGGLLDGLGKIKILLALKTIECRGRLEGFLLDGSFAARQTSRPGGAGSGIFRGESGTKESKKSLGMLARMLRELAWMNAEGDRTGLVWGWFSAGTEEGCCCRKNTIGDNGGGAGGSKAHLNCGVMAWCSKGLSVELYVPLLEFNHLGPSRLCGLS